MQLIDSKKLNDKQLEYSLKSYWIGHMQRIKRLTYKREVTFNMTQCRWKCEHLRVCKKKNFGGKRQHSWPLITFDLKFSEKLFVLEQKEKSKQLIPEVLQNNWQTSTLCLDFKHSFSQFESISWRGCSFDSAIAKIISATKHCLASCY